MEANMTDKPGDIALPPVTSRVSWQAELDGLAAGRSDDLGPACTRG
jgi:hypothetical protein